jgi:quercetin dioxygenase-like cupin family protein
MSKQTVVVKRGEAEELNAMGAVLRFVCGADKTERSWSLMEIDVPERTGPPPHDHPWDEAYYVLEGEVRFTLGAREQLLKAGDFIYAPGGTAHAFQGASARPARMLVFDSPAHSEAFFRELGREVKEMPRDLGKLPDIGKRHQIRFRAPSA